MTKPRIIRHQGMRANKWACFMPAPDTICGWLYPWGHGRTPAEAFDKWKRTYVRATSR